MPGNLGKLALALPERAAGTHLLARHAAFRAEDCVCRMHARSPVVERAHPRAAIAVMLAGAFHARGSAGETVLGPGAMLLKNATTTHEYRHLDDGGDRTITFEYEDAFLEDVRVSFGARRRAFDCIAIPASADTAAAVALAHQAACNGDAGTLHDAAMAVAAAAIASDWGRSNQLAAPTLAQTRRVARVLRYLDAHSADDCSLDTLAALAGLTSFHFVRVFRAVTGQTPRQYVIAARLRAAAIALHSTRTPIMEVAFDAGFGDVSHFTTSFRRAFGVSPRRYRNATP